MTNDEAEHLEEILRAVDDIRSRLGDWDKKFIEDIEKQFEDKGAQLYLSPKQWAQLERIYATT